MTRARRSATPAAATPAAATPAAGSPVPAAPADPAPVRPLGEGVWVVLPTYNEAENVRPIGAAILESLPGATLLVV
ncbi:MAG TPA: hypothetical protein VFO78_10660, partial [Candidatus Limnocylindrales bacterium]|nr:hypothetical protein [Candidatus Limnocylindrales bacterium]